MIIFKNGDFMKSIIVLLSIALLSFFHIQAEEQKRWEINLENWLPSQVPFSKVAVESTHLDAQIVLQDGSVYCWDNEDEWPEIKEINEINLSGMQATLILVMKTGEEICAPLDGVCLQLVQNFQNTRREVSLDLSLLPSKKEDSDNKFEAAFSSLTVTLIRTLILGGDDAIRLHLQGAADIDTGQHPSGGLQIELGADSLELNFALLESQTTFDWALRGELSGDALLVNRIVNAFKLIGKGTKLIDLDNRKQELLQWFISYGERIADLIQPFIGWEGMGISILGKSAYEEIDEELFELSNVMRFQLEAVNGSGMAWIASETNFIGGGENASQWRQAIVVDNPGENLLKIAQWIQKNALDDLANFLNTPSIKYFGYLGERFALELAKLFDMLGSKQEDGTLHFVIERDEQGTKICSVRINEIGNMFYQKLKAAASWW